MLSTQEVKWNSKWHQVGLLFFNCPVRLKMIQSNRTRDHNTGGRCIQGAGSAVWYHMIYLLTAIGLTPGGCNTVHIYPQTIHRTTQQLWLEGFLGFEPSGKTNWEECWPSPDFASYTLAFALQLRKKHGKTSVRAAEECQLARWKRNVQNTETIRNWQELQTSMNDMFVGCQACVRVEGDSFQHCLKRVVSCIFCALYKKMRLLDYCVSGISFRLIFL